MAMWSTILGFSLWGLASRVGQLGIQKRPLMSNPAGHLLAAGVFGYLGYWAHRWDMRAQALIAEKQLEIQQRQSRLAAARERAALEAEAEAADTRA